MNKIGSKLCLSYFSIILFIYFAWILNKNIKLISNAFYILKSCHYKNKILKFIKIINSIFIQMLPFVASL